MALSIVLCSGAKHLNIVPTVPLDTKIFTNKEIFVQVKLNGKSCVDGKDVFVIQSFKDPNSHLMELLLTVNALKLANCKTITAVIPYFPYARQDKMHSKGTPISARVVCDILTTVGVNRIVSFDLHSDQIQGFASVPFFNIKMGAFFAKKLKEEFPDFADNTWKFVSADLGSSKRNKKFANLCGSNKVCNIVKHRVEDQEIESMYLTGKITGYNACLFDDMVDTGGTLGGGYDLMRENGALRIVAIATHPVLSVPEKAKQYLDKITIFTSNTCEHDYTPAKTRIFGIEGLLLEIINRIDRRESIDDLEQL